MRVGIAVGRVPTPSCEKLPAAQMRQHPGRRAGVGNRQMHICHPITKQAGQAIEIAIVEKMNELFADSGIERSDEQYDRHSKATHTRK